MSANNRADLWDESQPLTAEEFAPDSPDHEILVYRNTVHRSERYPKGFECLITLPRSKIDPAALPPFWRHGEVMHTRESIARPSDPNEFRLQSRGIPR